MSGTYYPRHPQTRLKAAATGACAQDANSANAVRIAVTVRGLRPRRNGDGEPYPGAALYRPSARSTPGGMLGAPFGVLQARTMSSRLGPSRGSCHLLPQSA